MRILVLADEESKYYWDYFDKAKLEGIDLILSCGDLKPEYLSFLATFAKVPILYVRGNHDDIYETRPPEGCICIEDTIYTYQGIRILGLGGSIRYKKGKNQYTQKEMNRRINKMWFSIKKNKGFDILLTHSPAPGLPASGLLPLQQTFSTGHILFFFCSVRFSFSFSFPFDTHIHEIYSVSSFLSQKAFPGLSYKQLSCCRQ